jgi:hypothetical protein
LRRDALENTRQFLVERREVGGGHLGGGNPRLGALGVDGCEAVADERDRLRHP